MTSANITATVLDMSNTQTTHFEFSGPAERAAVELAERGWRIVSVNGSNGCDFKNGTADEYLVEVTADSADTSYEHNLALLKAYHVGDRQHYLTELRQDARRQLRHYAAESLNRPRWVLDAKVSRVIDEALATIDKEIN